jgi:ABC-type nitrate/sulfonate/bicarbonate transport system permease component
VTVTQSPRAAPPERRRGLRDLAGAGPPGRLLRAVPAAFWLGLAGLAGCAGLLEVAPRVGLVPQEYAPPTSRILAELVAQAGQPMLWTALRNTLTTWAVGLSIAVAAGLVLGMVIGSLPVLRAATASTIEFLRPIPSVAWIPVAVVLYGSSRTSTLILVVYASFWQVLVQVLHGVVDVDPVARETARSYRLGRWARVRWLVWPTALPYVVTGVRLAVAVALILTVTGELLIGTPGLGNEISIASTSRAVPLTYALVLVTGLVGVAANLLARAAERRLLNWHQSQRKEVAAT